MTRRTKSGQPSKNGEKTADGKFAAGNKLGKGRPQGSRNKASLAVDALLEAQILHKFLLQKKIADKTRITIHDHPQAKASRSREKSSPLQRHLNSKSYDAAVARDCRMVCQPGAPIEHNAVWRRESDGLRI